MIKVNSVAKTEMNPIFEALDCTKTACMNRNYSLMQNQLSGRSLDPISTYRRCFKDSDVEQQLRTEQYLTRSCLGVVSGGRSASLDNVAEWNEAAATTPSLQFFAHTKRKDAL